MSKPTQNEQRISKGRVAWCGEIEFRLGEEDIYVGMIPGRGRVAEPRAVR